MPKFFAPNPNSFSVPGNIYSDVVPNYTAYIQVNECSYGENCYRQRPRINLFTKKGEFETGDPSKNHYHVCGNWENLGIIYYYDPTKHTITNSQPLGTYIEVSSSPCPFGQDCNRERKSIDINCNAGEYLDDVSDEHYHVNSRWIISN